MLIIIFVLGERRMRIVIIGIVLRFWVWGSWEIKIKGCRSLWMLGGE